MFVFSTLLNLLLVSVELLFRPHTNSVNIWMIFIQVPVLWSLSDKILFVYNEPSCKLLTFSPLSARSAGCATLHVTGK